MNIPSPAALKQKLDEMRASKPTPPKESSPSKGGKSAAPRSFRKGKGQATSNLSTANRSTKSSSKKTISGSESSTSTTQTTLSTKKPFVLKKHLTQRPLQNDSGLVALKKSLEGGSKRTHNRPRVSAKTSQSKNKKENN